MAWLDTDYAFDIIGLPHGSPVSFVDNHMVIGVGLGELGVDRIKWAGGSAGQFNENGIPYGTAADTAVAFLEEQRVKGLVWDGNAWVDKATMVQEAVAAAKAQGTKLIIPSSSSLPPWFVPAAVVAAVGLVGLAVWKRSRRGRKK